MDLAVALRSLTDEQLHTVHTLTKAPNQAATTLANLTNRLRQAAVAGDKHTFLDYPAAIQRRAENLPGLPAGCRTYHRGIRRAE